MKGQETTYKSVQLSNCLLCVLIGGHGGESVSLTSSGVSVIDNLLGTCHIVTITSHNAQKSTDGITRFADMGITRNLLKSLSDRVQPMARTVMAMPSLLLKY